jgi:hypothetical protein
VNAPPPPDYSVRPDAAYSQIRQIESAGTLRSVGADVTLRGQWTRVFNGTAQYGIGRVMNDTSGINWMPPNMYDLSREYAPADYDRLQNVQLFGSVNAGAWANFGASFEYDSPRPYTITTGLDLYNTGIANARPPGVGRNTERGLSFAALDLRWWREFPSAATGKRPKRSFTFGIDAFNVTNRVNYNTPVGNLSSPFFGQPISAQPARRIQFSLRVKY